jgi:mono/diheme cytochrome c family protein
MNKNLFLSALIVAGCGLSVDASADPRTVNDAVYSEAQADSGELLYKDQCLTCHDKKYFRPVLKRWEGQQLGVFFTVMSASMPESNPGSLPDAQYLDILAYILSLSRYPAGDAALHNDDGALGEITIAKRK